jgi:hypothetical protein
VLLEVVDVDAPFERNQHKFAVWRYSESRLRRSFSFLEDKTSGRV